MTALASQPNVHVELHPEASHSLRSACWVRKAICGLTPCSLLSSQIRFNDGRIQSLRNKIYGKDDTFLGLNTKMPSSPLHPAQHSSRALQERLSSLRQPVHLYSCALPTGLLRKGYIIRVCTEPHSKNRDKLLNWVVKVFSFGVTNIQRHDKKQKDVGAAVPRVYCRLSGEEMITNPYKTNFHL